MGWTADWSSKNDNWKDRASARSETDREQVYQAWLERQSLYDTPERRALHFRRYKPVRTEQ